MNNYSFDFKVVGEVADLLDLTTPEPKLLVDISSDPPGHEVLSIKKYPTRTTLTIVNEALIKKILGEVSTGDVIEAVGTFIQTNYIPYRTAYIDTTFLTAKFTVLEKASKAKKNYRSVYSEGAFRSVH